MLSGNLYYIELGAIIHHLADSAFLLFVKCHFQIEIKMTGIIMFSNGVV